MHKPATRVDAARLGALLHAAFKEVGRSGRTYTKAEILLSLQAEPQRSTVIADHFEVVSLAAEVALLTYQSAQLLADGTLDRFSVRASVWKYSELGWQMIFHQGTPISSGREPHTAKPRYGIIQSNP